MKRKHTTKKSANRQQNPSMIKSPANWYRSFAMYQHKLKMQMEEEKKKKENRPVKKAVNRVSKFLGIQKRKV